MFKLILNWNLRWKVLKMNNLFGSRVPWVHFNRDYDSYYWCSVCHWLTATWRRGRPSLCSWSWVSGSIVLFLAGTGKSHFLLSHIIPTTLSDLRTANPFCSIYPDKIIKICHIQRLNFYRITKLNWYLLLLLIIFIQ